MQSNFSSFYNNTGFKGNLPKNVIVVCVLFLPSLLKTFSGNPFSYIICFSKRLPIFILCRYNVSYLLFSWSSSVFPTEQHFNFDQRFGRFSFLNCITNFCLKSYQKLFQKSNVTVSSNTCYRVGGPPDDHKDRKLLKWRGRQGLAQH